MMNSQVCTLSNSNNTIPAFMKNDEFLAIFNVIIIKKITHLEIVK